MTVKKADEIEPAGIDLAFAHDIDGDSYHHQLFNIASIFLRMVEEQALQTDALIGIKRCLEQIADTLSHTNKRK